VKGPERNQVYWAPSAVGRRDLGDSPTQSLSRPQWGVYAPGHLCMAPSILTTPALHYRVGTTARPARFQAETGSYLRLIESCITQLTDQGPSRTCNESKEEEGGNREIDRAQGFLAVPFCGRARSRLRWEQSI